MRRIARAFAAFSHPTRLRIVSLLFRRPFCVCELVSLLRQPYSKLSNHLRILSKAGFVKKTKEVWWIQYALASLTPRSSAGRLIETARRALRGSRTASADLKRLDTSGVRRPPREICLRLRRAKRR